ncbi:hypothetical protein CPB86DRAFT_552539 [Serendipita vermifera]|nr:hypothetical protein CPB86DRAFT_552539 [Serendipita vermifera]
MDRRSSRDYINYPPSMSTPTSPHHVPSSSRSTINDPTVVVRFQENPLVRRGSVATTATNQTYTTQGARSVQSQRSQRDRKNENPRSGTLALMTTLNAPSAPRANRSSTDISPSGAHSSSYASSSSSGAGGSSGLRSILRRSTGPPSDMGRQPPTSHHWSNNSDDLLSEHEKEVHRSRSPYDYYDRSETNTISSGTTESAPLSSVASFISEYTLDSAMISNDNDSYEDASRPSTRMAGRYDRQDTIRREEWAVGGTAGQGSSSAVRAPGASEVSLPYSMQDTDNVSVYRAGDGRASSVWGVDPSARR